MMTTMSAPCPRCDKPLLRVEAVPNPPPARVYRVSGADEEDPGLGVCVPCDLLVRGVREYVEAVTADRITLDEATGRAAAARALFKQGDPHGAMRDLARAFPALRDAVPGVDPWDPVKLDAWLGGGSASDTELATAAFILRVWNAHGPWSRPFDAMDILGRWDAVNRAVFVEWARSPWWP
jgi:hypothetical protein